MNVLGAASAGAAATAAGAALLRRRPPGGGERWDRVNHRGAPVTLLAGPAVAGGATLAASAAAGPPLAAAAAVAGAAAALAGIHDDLAGSGSARGFRGHFAALRRGEPTTGSVKVGTIGAAALLAATLTGPRHPLDVALGGAVVAGCANLVNLLDLRPGRALKAVALAGAALGALPGPARPVAAATAGAALVALPDDLAERAMVGDGGANSLGALLGLALVARSGRRSRAGALAGLVVLTAASEVISYSRVIDATPPLRWLDRLGRRP